MPVFERYPTVWVALCIVAASFYRTMVFVWTDISECEKSDTFARTYHTLEGRIQTLDNQFSGGPR